MKTGLKLEYLSDVVDSKTGEISKPFTIANKNYQMVRAINPNRQKVMGVYCMDEFNEDGSNKIYEINEFEETVAKKHLGEEGVVEPEAPEMATLNPYPLEEKNKESKHPSFAGYKHFIVNEKTGKARKFKSIEELAKASMKEGEKYMGVKEFKRFVDETLFGPSKRNIVKELDDANQPNEENDMNAKAKRLMDYIKKAPKVPEAIENLKTSNNPIAQAQVIAAFAEEIGVPINRLSQIVSSIKQTAKQQQQQQQQPAAQAAPVTESKKSKIIKKKDIK